MDGQSAERWSDQQIVLSFANSRGFGRGPDRLTDAVGLRDWLDEVGWLGDATRGSQVTDADAAEARELREALLVTLLSNARDPAIGAQQVRLPRGCCGAPASAIS